MMTIAILFAFASFIIPSHGEVRSWNLDRLLKPALNKRTHVEIIIYFASPAYVQRHLIRFDVDNTTSIKTIVSQISNSKFEATHARAMDSDPSQVETIDIDHAIGSIRSKYQHVPRVIVVHVKQNRFTGIEQMTESE